MLSFIKNSSLLLVMFLISTITLAQTDGFPSLYIESNEGMIFQPNGSDEKPGLRKNGNVNNIFIEQIGLNNTVDADISAQSSDIVLSQNGNFNKAWLDLTTKSATGVIEQNGNKNYFGEYANAPKLNLERSIIQQGRSNQVMIYGSNSLTEKLKIKVSGLAKSVIIRNFN
ncbi:hypothetical protein [Maribacter sp. ACAM166]|uniref:hypothetical protein n=1 Tax=Maribacter sp. ACAM166 TaxID=2508996 RepID=UPI0010FD1290|nr:hypothetical protein [Maribacter sp. ACAM166]TLP80467.1 hypothetical protein ES765_08360 [Maribacter sp. ACAM166]